MSINTKQCVIIDTDCANLNSVKFALLRLGAKVTISDKANIINNAERIILPGVGSAKAAMQSLRNKNLVSVIQNLQQPVLGICLGMQLLTTRSFEAGLDNECLGILNTEITELNTNNQPSPHMGWNQIKPNSHPLFKNIPINSYVYYVHSYRAPLSDLTLATSEYGEKFSGAIGKNNFMGVQFHPEKSASIGSKILNNFLELTL